MSCDRTSQHLCLIMLLCLCLLNVSGAADASAFDERSKVVLLTQAFLDMAARLLMVLVGLMVELTLPNSISYPFH